MGSDGILSVNKPRDCTSFGVVARIRRMTGEKRVGHAGTLDPAASGVLPVCLGQATRVTEYLHAFSKQYVADVELGISTDTYDGQGRVTSYGDARKVDISALREALEGFRGDIDQVPPAYSAIKIDGRQAYSLAREGIKIAMQPRRVHVESLDVLTFEPPYATLSITCSKGTYVRSLVNDLGERLACGAYLRGLVRTAYGPFTLQDSVSLDEIQAMTQDSTLSKVLYPVDYPLLGLRRLALDAEAAKLVLHGSDVAADCLGAESPCRAYAPDGKFIAIMKFVPESHLWHPDKVFTF